MVVMVAVDAKSAAFGLKGGLHLHKIRSQAMEHILNHMVGPNAEKLVSNFGRQCRFPSCQARRISRLRSLCLTSTISSAA